GLAKSNRGGFNITPAMTLMAHAISNAVDRSGVERAEVEDCLIGNVRAGAHNLGRNVSLLAGLPVTTSGVTINRFCSSGMQSIAMGARYITDEGATTVVAGGVEQLSYPGAPHQGGEDPKL